MHKYFSIKIPHRIRQVKLADGFALQRLVWPDYSLEAVHDRLGRVFEMARQDRVISLVIATQPIDESFAYGQITRWPRVAEISDLTVAIDKRGQGFGSALIEALILRSLHWRLSRIEIGVAVSNTRALVLYHRLGFTDTREVLLNLGNGLEPVLYLTREQRDTV